MFYRFKIIIHFQTIARGWFGRLAYTDLRRQAKVLIIQRTVRGWMARQQYHRVIRGIIKLQGHVRRKKAKRELKKLKVERERRYSILVSDIITLFMSDVKRSVFLLCEMIFILRRAYCLSFDWDFGYFSFGLLNTYCFYF